MFMEVRTKRRSDLAGVRRMGVSWPAILFTGLVFGSKFIPYYIASFGLSLLPLEKKEVWKQFGADLLWAIPVGFIVIIIRLLRLRQK
jgi:hypothetical protein